MNNMRRPTWATIIGVLMIIFGVFGILGAAQFMFIGQVFDFEEGIFEKIKDKAIEEDPGSEIILEEVEKMLDTPDWFNSFATIFGLLGLLLQGLYLFAGISLLQVKHYAIQLTYTSIGLYMLFAVIQCIVGAQLDSLLSIMLIAGGLMSIVIDMVLLIVVATADKRVFEQTSLPPMPHTNSI